MGGDRRVMENGWMMDHELTDTKMCAAARSSIRAAAFVAVVLAVIFRFVMGRRCAEYYRRLQS